MVWIWSNLIIYSVKALFSSARRAPACINAKKETKRNDVQSKRQFWDIPDRFSRTKFFFVFFLENQNKLVFFWIEINKFYSFSGIGSNYETFLLPES